MESQVSDYTEYDYLLEGCKKEEDLQEYLEKHNHMLPIYDLILRNAVLFVCLILKFRLVNKYVSDFVYLAKKSAEWWVVFVELENPNYKMFTKEKNFTYHFNQAYEQVESWINYLKDSQNKQNVLTSLKNLRTPTMRNTNVFFKYTLVYGREDERDQFTTCSEKRLQKQSQEIKIRTYDSIKNTNCRRGDCMILTPKGDSDYCVEFVPDNFVGDQGIFTWIPPENLTVPEESFRKLKTMGYDMESWKKGIPLSLDGKFPNEEMFPNFGNKSHIN